MNHQKSAKVSVSLTQETIDLLDHISSYQTLPKSAVLRQLIIKQAEELGLKKISKEPKNHV